VLLLALGAVAQSVGVFDGRSDVGSVLHQGTLKFDAAQKTYTVSGGGENIWVAPDAFHFVWKKVSGDVALSADVVVGTGKNPHRKAVLMIRQSLDADSAYADVALHGDGLTSLQFRDVKGAATHEVQAVVRGPKRLKLVKRGDYVYMMLARDGESLALAGGSVRVAMSGTYYVGIGVCAHDNNELESAQFSNVSVTGGAPTGNKVLYSILETMQPDTIARKVVYVTRDHIEAPNWTRDGQAFLFNGNGRIHRLAVQGGTPTTIDTGFAIKCNNDHGISPDGRTLVISDNSQEEHRSIVYTLPLTGGTPKRVTQNSPSYWHGWSPDGKTLTFVGERGGEFDVYTIPVEGGAETRLTTAKGLDDGPEYSPDGKYIYVNSERTGRMQIWRMRADGSEQEQVTKGEYNDWFPHLSPDGRSMVFLSFGSDVQGHPPNKDVMLRMMTLNDQKVVTLTSLFGGQGTINVPSWSPDGKQFAFVSYQFVDEEDAAGK
jgi:hypothetical protein